MLKLALLISSRRNIASSISGIGAWEVTIGGKKKVGSSKIESIVGARVILQNYSEPKGFHGKSINFYDPVLGKWRENKSMTYDFIYVRASGSAAPAP